VTAVDDDGELDPCGPAVVEERLDRGADGAAGVQDVVDEDDRSPVEREVELRRADERLRCERRLAPTDGDVVAVEGDVDGAERGSDSGALLNQARQPPRERDAAGLDPDERDVLELGVALDDLVGDSRKGPRQPVGVEEGLPLYLAGSAGGEAATARPWRGGARRAGGRTPRRPPPRRPAVAGRLRRPLGRAYSSNSFPASLDRVKGVRADVTVAAPPDNRRGSQRRTS
jgi:hypothetical protein